jgi:hypothetical protein
MRYSATRRALAAMFLVLAVGVGGCVSSQPSRADQGLVWGYVAAAKNAQLVVDAQKSSVLAVALSKVVAPEAGWVNVYEDDGGVLGRRVGQIRVERGVTENVGIPLDPLKSNRVFVLMHADRGKPNVFEFDEQRKDDSPDRPIFVGGTELMVPAALRPYGVKTAPGTARIAVYRQGSIGATLTVGDVLAPADSWIAVQLEQNGRPGKVIGTTHVPAGSYLDLQVALAPGNPQQNLYATLFADSGVAGEFEFDPLSPLRSVDQPYFIDGAAVAAEVPVKRN